MNNHRLRRQRLSRQRKLAWEICLTTFRHRAPGKDKSDPVFKGIFRAVDYTDWRRPSRVLDSIKDAFCAHGIMERS